MIDIIVIRNLGDVPGEDIIDPLITDVAAAKERGRNAIDASTEISPVNLRTVYRAGLETGQTVNIMDSLQGEDWVGKITSVDIAVEGIDVSATLSVERAIEH